MNEEVFFAVAPGDKAVALSIADHFTVPRSLAFGGATAGEIVSGVRGKTAAGFATDIASAATWWFSLWWGFAGGNRRKTGKVLGTSLFDGISRVISIAHTPQGQEAYSRRKPGCSSGTRTKEDDMQRMHMYLGSLLLGVTLVAPVGLQAGNSFRDDSRQDARERNERDQRRYYDRDYKDYHRWDNREDDRYRSWGSERHEVYRPFYKLHREQQRAYWKYRHEHPDGDDRR